MLSTGYGPYKPIKQNNIPLWRKRTTDNDEYKRQTAIAPTKTNNKLTWDTVLLTITACLQKGLIKSKNIVVKNVGTFIIPNDK